MGTEEFGEIRIEVCGVLGVTGGEESLVWVRVMGRSLKLILRIASV